MDMARATRARIECLSCHRCHLFRMAERTCGHRAEHNIRAWIWNLLIPPGTHRRGAQGATQEVVTFTSSTLHICWDSLLKCSEEGVPFSDPHECAKWPLAGRTPTLNPCPGAQPLLVSNNPLHRLIDEIEVPAPRCQLLMRAKERARHCGSSMDRWQGPSWGSQQRPPRDWGAGMRGLACGGQEEDTDLLWSQRASRHPEPQPGVLTSLLRKQ